MQIRLPDQDVKLNVPNVDILDAIGVAKRRVDSALEEYSSKRDLSASMISNLRGAAKQVRKWASFVGREGGTCRLGLTMVLLVSLADIPGIREEDQELQARG